MNFRKQHSIDPVPIQLAPLVDVLFLSRDFLCRYLEGWAAGEAHGRSRTCR